MANDQKTEKPTAHRLQKARGEGRIAVSRDLPATASLVAAAVALLSLDGDWVARWAALWRDALAAGRDIDVQRLDVLAWKWVVAGTADLFLPVVAAAAAAAVVAGVAQTGGLFSPTSLKPEWTRLNPFAGVGRLLSPRQGGEALMSLAKAGLFSLIGGRIVWRLAVNTPVDAALGAGPAAAAVMEGFERLLVDGLLFFSAAAAWDYFQQHRRWQGEMRMTKQEVREEHRETEGNPQIKSRIRALRKKMASRRMMSQVPKADVVITNPTHLAVALRYRPKAGAPEVVAKGADLMAKRIREKAAKHGVPTVENKPLAQLLYQKVDVGGAVPVSLYQAVAEVLAYVYRLKHHGR